MTMIGHPREIYDFSQDFKISLRNLLTIIEIRLRGGRKYKNSIVKRFPENQILEKCLGITDRTTANRSPDHKKCAEGHQTIPCLRNGKSF